jgi:hypothetical protein
MRPTNITEATNEILFRIRTLEPLIVAQTEESGRVTKALIQTIANWNDENPTKAKTLYIWHHLNGLTLYDAKDNPKIYPMPGDALKQAPAAYEHILSWVNETGDPTAPTIAINSVVLVPQYEQLFSDIAPLRGTAVTDGVFRGKFDAMSRVTNATIGAWRGCYWLAKIISPFRGGLLLSGVHANGACNPVG